MKEYLVLKDISKKYFPGTEKEISALDRLNLEVRKGEFLTLLGPSGSGKTTALRIIAGLEAPSEGQIFLEGRNINALAPHKRSMPMVFQSYALFPHMTVFENIAYGLRARKMSREVIRNDVAMACQVVNLVGLENRFPSELSGGQQQRVALARTLVLKPHIILFDEPLSNLDVKLRIQTRTEIKRVHRMLGITVIYVTHDQSEALSLSDRIIVMNRGEMIQSGSPEEIYNSPATPFVADFIGNTNFLTAVIEEIEGHRISLRLQEKLLVLKVEKHARYFHEGEEVYLSIKPEAVSISRQPGDYCAVVDVKSFLGSHTEYRVEFDGSFLNIHKPNTGPDRHNFLPGEKAYLSFDKTQLRLYKK